MKNRSEIEDAFKWNIVDYCKSIKEWESRFKEILKKGYELFSFEGKLKDEETILDWFNKTSNFSKDIEVLSCYINLKHSEDTTNSMIEEKINFFSGEISKIEPTLAAIETELYQLPKEKLESLKNNPKFKDYDLSIREIIRTKKYILSKPEEKLIAKTMEFSDGFSDVFDMFDNADLKYDDVKDSKGKVLPLDNSTKAKYLMSSDRVLRKNTMISQHNAFKKVNKTLSANYISNIKKNWCYASLRGFGSCLESSIFYENASEKVYKLLIEKVNANLKKFSKFYDIKRKQLKLDKFAIYDTFANPVKKLEKKYSYDDGCKIVLEATSVLGNEYVSQILKAFDNKWIDVYPSVGKDSGAFSTSAYSKHPIVLMNYVDDVNSVFTLAHELGHSMHSYLSDSKQCYEKAQYKIFVAEVASITNELLVYDYLIKKAKTKKEKIYFYDYILNTFRTTVLRQTMFAQFEEHTHSLYEKGEPISSDILNDYYYKLVKKYFGEKVEMIDEIKYEWSRIPHLFYNFYVYKYATGLISALAISQNIINGKENAAKNYLEFLSCGKTLPPVELLRKAGVDLENPKTYDDAFEFIKSILKEYEFLVN